MWLLKNGTNTLQRIKHDRMLRPPYHSILEKYEFSESEKSLPWYKHLAFQFNVWRMIKQKYDGIFHHLEKYPRNGANKPDMNVLDKMNKEWYIIEGTVCMLGTIPARTMFKRDKYED